LVSANTAQLVLASRARCGNLDAVAFGLLHLGRGGEVDRRRIEANVHRFGRGCALPGQEHTGERKHGHQAARQVQSKSPGHGGACHPAAPPMVKNAVKFTPPGCVWTLRRFRGSSSSGSVSRRQEIRRLLKGLAQFFQYGCCYP
jgi:hypothetical protein